MDRWDKFNSDDRWIHYTGGSVQTECWCEVMTNRCERRLKLSEKPQKCAQSPE
ncbi:hypothetical protein PAMA_013481 [Pampus argenteus]